MEIAGYIAAILIGISLGLIGGGGSTLAVPVLVYLFHIAPTKAVPDSLFIVGVSSFIGALSYLSKKLVCFKSIFAFGLPSLVSVYFTRTWLSPAIPVKLQFFGSFTMSKDVFLLVIFAFLMLAASFSMIRPLKLDKESSGKKQEEGVYPYLQMMFGGLCVGFLAGLVGAGGGFLIIPALVVLARLPMKQAIGTSLLIISINSAMGFLGDLQNPEAVNWSFLLLFTSLSVCGIFGGMYVSRFVSGSSLKPAFGWFILCIGGFIISQQLIKIL
jgi:uncharacterized membrane protein YfcA